MPCNAIAAVTGGVTDESLRRLLEQNDEQVQSAIQSYLAQRLAGSTTTSYNTASGFGLRVSVGYQWFDLRVQAGKVAITTAPANRATADQLTAELTELLTLLGQQLFEQAVADFIQQSYAVEQSQRTNDALVLTFNI